MFYIPSSQLNSLCRCSDTDLHFSILKYLWPVSLWLKYSNAFSNETTPNYWFQWFIKSPTRSLEVSSRMGVGQMGHKKTSLQSCKQSDINAIMSHIKLMHHILPFNIIYFVREGLKKVGTLSLEWRNWNTSYCCQLNHFIMLIVCCPEWSVVNVVAANCKVMS